MERRRLGQGRAVEGDKSLDSVQILWLEPIGFTDRLDVGVRERKGSRTIPRCLA